MSNDNTEADQDTRITLFQALGGEPTLQALVGAFYRHMQRPEYAFLLSLHPDLARAEDRLYKYLTGWTGGPQLFVQEFGHPMLRARHLHVSVDTRGRDEWLACMRDAMQDTVPLAELRAILEEALAPLADHMRNVPEA
ncbi:MAG: group II truncated hemoglobin [Pseudomonadota bacterium]|nr:group II truncated hemoglobin [Pseudomonadota bacterium]